ncbi:hypothetical protein MTR_5g098640 [Medicago truncatula]|uniref:Uncharacterized protein n=1 Tax=Medicago truncatula TaxID=3880 RepID=G7K0P2_MEDTR|nr:hypothetical protein MTR_5g098640 [Medicago truncatula]
MVENTEDDPGETKLNLVKKSGDVKQPNVEAKPSINGASVHVEASLYVDFGVLPPHANEVDMARFFSNDVKWKDRDDLLNWVHRQENKARFTIVIQRSSLINPMVQLVCERMVVHYHKNQEAMTWEDEYLGEHDLFRDLMIIEKGEKLLQSKKESNKAELIAEDEEDSISFYLPQSLGY